jgi:hypothetical protein
MTYLSRGESADADANAVITFRYPHPRSHYPLSAYEIMRILDYYLNLNTRLNNPIITIFKLK